MSVRNLIRGEELPERLRTGYEAAKSCDPDWIWLVERDFKPVAILVTAPAHLVVICIRLVATDQAEPSDVRALLVEFVRVIKERAYSGYVMWGDPTNDFDRALMTIIRRAGGVQLPAPQVACVGTV